MCSVKSEVIMKLKDYIEEENKTIQQVADDLGLPYEYVRRYAKENIIPSRETMQKIVVYTGGKVTANDFYDVEVKNEENT